VAIKFDAEFLERRMAEHRRWQHAAEHALIEEIIDDVQQLAARKPRPGRLFDLAPEHLRELVVGQ
jgi:hypothetical protein